MKNMTKITALRAEFKALQTTRNEMLTHIPNREYNRDGSPTAWTRKVRAIEKQMRSVHSKLLTLVLK